MDCIGGNGLIDRLNRKWCWALILINIEVQLGIQHRIVVFKEMNNRKPWFSFLFAIIAFLLDGYFLGSMWAWITQLAFCILDQGCFNYDHALRFKGIGNACINYIQVALVLCSVHGFLRKISKISMSIHEPWGTKLLTFLVLISRLHFCQLCYR